MVFYGGFKEFSGVVLAMTLSYMRTSVPHPSRDSPPLWHLAFDGLSPVWPAISGLMCI